jgi:hypothetical protein
MISYVRYGALAAWGLAAAAHGWGSLVASYASPGQYPNGLAYINAGYIALTTSTPDAVWLLNRSNASVVGSFAAPTTNTGGCTFGQINGHGYLWLSSRAPNYIYYMDWSTGSIHGSFAYPSINPHGVAFRAEGSSYYVYANSSYEQYLYYMNATTGSVHATYTLPFAPSYDGEYDAAHNCLWWAGGLTASGVYQLDSQGSLINSFGTGHSCTGLTYDPNTDYIWVGTGSLHTINVYEVIGVGVAPASLGRVKALFR